MGGKYSKMSIFSFCAVQHVKLLLPRGGYLFFFLLQTEFFLIQKIALLDSSKAFKSKSFYPCPKEMHLWKKRRKKGLAVECPISLSHPFVIKMAKYFYGLFFYLNTWWWWAGGMAGWLSIAENLLFESHSWKVM